MGDILKSRDLVVCVNDYNLNEIFLLLWFDINIINFNI